MPQLHRKCLNHRELCDQTRSFADFDGIALLSPAAGWPQADIPIASPEPPRSTSDRQSEVLRGGSGETTGGPQEGYRRISGTGSGGGVRMHPEETPATVTICAVLSSCTTICVHDEGCPGFRGRDVDRGDHVAATPACGRGRTGKA